MRLDFKVLVLLPARLSTEIFSINYSTHPSLFSTILTDSVLSQAFRSQIVTEDFLAQIGLLLVSVWYYKHTCLDEESLSLQWSDCFTN